MDGPLGTLRLFVTKSLSYLFAPGGQTDPTDPTLPTDPTPPTVPTVTFSSESYVVSVDTTQTGLVGRVSATADTGEGLTYSIGIDDGKRFIAFQ